MKWRWWIVGGLFALVWVVFVVWLLGGQPPMPR